MTENFVHWEYPENFLYVHRVFFVFWDLSECQYNSSQLVKRVPPHLQYYFSQDLVNDLVVAN